MDLEVVMDGLGGHRMFRRGLGRDKEYPLTPHAVIPEGPPQVIPSVPLPPQPPPKASPKLKLPLLPPAPIL